MTAFYRVAVVGARRRRQGTGEFIAARFAGLGHSVCAIIGTGSESLAATRDKLQLNHGIKAETYTDIELLFADKNIDILVIASPDETHLDYLNTAAHANCHVFCEKPLWWSGGDTCPSPDDAERSTTTLVELFDSRQCTLFVNLQWPHTLPSFQALYPDIALEAKHIERFEMRFSPASTGSRMVVDSAPHLLSMLSRLLGTGDIAGGIARYSDSSREVLMLSFDYHHAQGSTAVALVLKHHAGQPRPAGYSINGRSVERHVKMPDYLLSFAAQDQTIPIKDPLTQSVETFVESVRHKKPNPKRVIAAGMKHLCQLVHLSKAPPTQQANE